MRLPTTAQASLLHRLHAKKKIPIMEVNVNTYAALRASGMVSSVTRQTKRSFVIYVVLTPAGRSVARDLDLIMMSPTFRYAQKNGSRSKRAMKRGY